MKSFLLEIKFFKISTLFKKGFLVLFIVGNVLTAFSQNSIQLEAGVAFQIAGESNGTYDFLAKTGFQHLFLDTHQFRPYGRAGWMTNISSNYARLQATDFTVGIRWNNQSYKPWLFMEADLGGLYWDEQLISDLNERKILLDLSQLGLKGRFAVGLYCFEKALLKLSIEQYHTEATLLSINFGLEF